MPSGATTPDFTVLPTILRPHAPPSSAFHGTITQSIGTAGLLWRHCKVSLHDLLYRVPLQCPPQIAQKSLTELQEACTHPMTALNLSLVSSEKAMLSSFGFEKYKVIW